MSTTYKIVHRRLKKQRGPAAAHPCVECGGPAHDWAYDHSDPNELIGTSRTGVEKQHGSPYSEDLSRYVPMCIRCHQRMDHLARYGDACRKGHPRTEENVYVDAKGKPRCRECWREPSRRYAAKKAAS